MKIFYKFATSALAMCILAAGALAQTPLTTLSNLTEGIGAVTGNGAVWNGYSELILIPGASLLGVKSATTSFSIGFTAGSTADIGNMVLYKTGRSSNKILSVAKVKLGGVSNPSINLGSTAVCPVQPVSVANPCIVKLDAVKPALSPLNDYYLVLFFTDDSNNQHVSATGPAVLQGSLSGWYIQGDETRIKAKGTLPSGNNDQAPYFLMYVTNE